MSIQLNGRLDEQAALIQATANGALATTVGAGSYVSLKGYRKATIIIDITNATTVTGTVVNLKQATAVAGTGAKALAFTRMLSNIDVAASQAMVETAVTSNTFTSDTTNSKRLRYVIEIDSNDLDVANAFDCIACICTLGAASTGSVSYILRGARYSGADPTVD